MGSGIRGKDSGGSDDGWKETAKSSFVFVRQEGNSLASRPPVGELGLGTASLSRLLARHRSGVRFLPAPCEGTLLCLTSLCSVRQEGIGPSTSVLSGQRSTTELLTRISKLLTRGSLTGG